MGGRYSFDLDFGEELYEFCEEELEEKEYCFGGLAFFILFYEISLAWNGFSNWFFVFLLFEGGS